MKRKPPLGLRLDDETEKLFREVAEKEERDLSAQFRVIFKDWLKSRGTPVFAEPRTEYVIGRNSGNNTPRGGK